MDQYKKLLKLLFESLEKEQKAKSKLDKIVDKIRDFWWKYVIYTITTGIIILFVASFLFDKSISINVMNAWVGIILGLVAMIIGIISMFLSFYNLDQSIITQKETLDKIESIKQEIIENTEKNSQKTIDELHKSQYSKSDNMKLNVERKDWD